MNRIEKVRGVMDEILKDADVMQHILYNPLFEIKPQEKKRFKDLKREFAIEIYSIMF